MNQTVEIDEIDVKILRELIQDARKKLKDIAKECSLSSNAIFKRIKRLKATGVITGTIIYTNLESSAYEQPATIGINLNANQEPRVSKIIRKHGNLIALHPSVGKYDLSAFVMAKNLTELEQLKQIIRKQPGVRRIAINFWNKCYFNFDNVDFATKRS
jgi:Lrp/AsnC family transcriptional regulator for asnA, asnC and gidA